MGEARRGEAEMGGERKERGDDDGGGGRLTLFLSPFPAPIFSGLLPSLLAVFFYILFNFFISCLSG